jgi:fumarylacetoacetase
MSSKIDISRECPFTLDNIPFGVIKTSENPNPRCASAIGEFALDLVTYTRVSHLDGIDDSISFEEIFNQVRQFPTSACST